MPLRRASVFLSILLFLIAADPARPQAPSGPLPGAIPQQQPALRSTTRLVQVSVVVLDKHGNPVTGLKPSDFTLFDDGSRQDIAFFSSASPAPTLEAHLLPPNVFTNRFDLKGQEPGTVSIVLFDALNTPSEDQSRVRRQVLDFLHNLKPQDRVAAYALSTQLFVLHDFTQDSSALVNAVNHFTPKDLAAFDASHPAVFDVPALADDPMWMRFQERVNQASAEIADQATLDRAEATSAAIQAIANHVASIPGRKNLIWVTGGFPLEIISEIIAPDRTTTLMTLQARLALQALDRVDMAIYPVDASGVVTASNMDPQNGYNRAALNCADCINEAPGVSPGMFARQNLRDSERMLADATGGQAFYGNNDIRDAMNRAFDDGRFSYELGFYPTHGQWNGKFRKLKIMVDGEGLKLRYRKGYFAANDDATGEPQILASLREAALGPIEATNLGMIVSAKPVQPLSTRELELHIGIDPKQLLLQVSPGYRKGAVDLFCLQRDASGKTLTVDKQHIDLNLGEKQYQYMTKAALVLARHLLVQPQASEIRVVLRDAGSGSLGSVSIPATSFFPLEAASSARSSKPN
ncbi:MAG TPA: VWA domain-containing protein [Terriglobales bacterium]|nr:VWA domain-containing protein [Terriglobales bacterium]